MAQTYQTYADPAAAQTQYVAAPAQTYAAPAGYAQPAYAPAPAYTYAPAYNPDEVRTIFVTGFPADVKERELNNLLRFVHGYEASQMHWKNGLAQGFALFSHGAAAQAAINQIHNLVFDDGAVLRCEMARKNMYIKDEAAAAAKRNRTGAEYTAYAPAPVAAAGTYYAPAPAASPVTAQPRSYVPVNNTKDNPPCNTLFIGNLSESTNEEELRSLFATQPGFRQLKVVRGARSVTCFVEFHDVPSAMAVHQSQQGAVLNSSDRGGIRIQYSKNPFGKKRDANGNWINTYESLSTYTPTYSPGGTAAAGPASGAQQYGADGVAQAYAAAEQQQPQPMSAVAEQPQQEQPQEQPQQPQQQSFSEPYAAAVPGSGKAGVDSPAAAAFATPMVPAPAGTAPQFAAATNGIQGYEADGVKMEQSEDPVADGEKMEQPAL